MSEVNGFSLETNIDGMKDCLIFLAVMVQRYGDNGVVSFPDEAFSLEGDYRVMVYVDDDTNQISLKMGKVLQ